MRNGERANPAVLNASAVQKLLDEKPSAALIPRPTVFQPLPRFSDAIGAEVWIKRDDVASFAVAGAKARKLELILGQARCEGFEALVTMGPPQSNTCRALAAACATLGIEAHLVLAGEPPETLTGNVLLSALLGARLHWVGELSHLDLERALSRRYAHLAEHQRTLLVPAGASNSLGVLAMVAGYMELQAQCEAHQIRPAEIIHASATGGVWAGLAIGAELVDGPRPRAVLVTDEIYDDPGAAYSKLAHGCVTEMFPDEELVLPVPTLDVSQVAGGYGQAEQSCLDAIGLLARTEGILCDPIYTGKALAALIARAQAGAFDGQPVVFWHTGGIQGIGDAEVSRLLSRYARANPPATR